MRTSPAALACCACAASLTFGGAALADPAMPHPIDLQASKATFTVQHVFVEHVSGTVRILSGSITLRPGSMIPLGATAVLDGDSINTDESDRDASLESPDFFDARKFPRWTFSSTKVTPESDAAFGMDGLLTLHGVTQPEHLEVTARREPGCLVYHALAHIDRHAFGMSITRLDPVIGGIAEVTLDLVVR